MGYSCTVKADYALESMLTQLQAASGREVEQSNAWIFQGQNYFFEQGREHVDGSITGAIIRTMTGKIAGNARISADGIVERWAKSTPSQRQAAFAASDAKYALTYGGISFQVI